MALQSLVKETNPLMGYRFLVEISGIITGGFSDVSGLQAETEVETIREGGLNSYAYKLPKATTYSNLILKRGITSPSSELMWAWYRGVIAGKVLRMPVFIMLQNEDRTINPTAIWCAWDAYPVKWVGPDLRADSSHVAIETLELAHHGIERV